MSLDVDPMDRHEDPPAALIAEQLAEDRAMEFHALVLEAFEDRGEWASVVGCLSLALTPGHEWESEFVKACRDYATEYGPAEVLFAIGRAMRQQEADAANSEVRR